jgi:hypothetical protein
MNHGKVLGWYGITFWFLFYDYMIHVFGRRSQVLSHGFLDIRIEWSCT